MEQNRWRGGRGGREVRGSMLMPVYGEISHRDPIIVSLPCSSPLMERICCCTINFSVRLRGQNTDCELSFLLTETYVIIFFSNSDFSFLSSHMTV